MCTHTHTQKLLFVSWGQEWLCIYYKQYNFTLVWVEACFNKKKIHKKFFPLFCGIQQLHILKNTLNHRMLSNRFSPSSSLQLHDRHIIWCTHLWTCTGRMLVWCPTPGPARFQYRFQLQCWCSPWSVVQRYCNSPGKHKDGLEVCLYSVLRGCAICCWQWKTLSCRTQLMWICDHFSLYCVASGQFKFENVHIVEKKMPKQCNTSFPPVMCIWLQFNLMYWYIYILCAFCIVWRVWSACRHYIPSFSVIM